MNERRKRAEVSKQSAQMFSFKKGMQTLPKALAAKLGVRANFLTDVESVRFDGAEYAVKYNRAGDFRGEVKAKAVISTIPAYLASKVFSELIPDAAAHFDAIIHPPVNVLYLGYEAKDVKRELDGFGFLIPEKENKSFLGAIWSSTLFPQRAPLDVVTFTLFIGGMRNAGFLQNGNDDLSKKVLTEFNEIMHISASPVFQAHRFWQKAIPQYTLGYIEHERYFDSIEAKFPGLFISGNFRGGISVGDCVKNSGLVSEKVLNYLNKKRYVR
jgi:oxygen-dependent protoporphyrinogen oxidase